jgi:hypothetical protein
MDSVYSCDSPESPGSPFSQYYSCPWLYELCIVHESKPTNCTLTALNTALSVTATTAVVVGGGGSVGSSVFVHGDDLCCLSNVQCVHYWCVPVYSVLREIRVQLQ